MKISEQFQRVALAVALAVGIGAVVVVGNRDSVAQPVAGGPLGPGITLLRLTTGSNVLGASAARTNYIPSNAGLDVSGGKDLCLQMTFSHSNAISAGGSNLVIYREDSVDGKKFQQTAATVWTINNDQVSTEMTKVTNYAIGAVKRVRFYITNGAAFSAISNLTFVGDVK